MIVENTPAKKVYQRIGFSITRNLRSFSGEISNTSEAIKPELTTYSEVLQTGLYDSESYCWESRAEAVKMAEELTKSYLVRDVKQNVEGYFTLGQAGNIIQLEEKDGNYSALLNSVGTLEENVKLKNVASDRNKLISELENRGFKNTVNQHEMELLLS
ncbi:hypothetical protein GCM10010465_11570 [Actinomadura fibrosa]